MSELRECQTCGGMFATLDDGVCVDCRLADAYPIANLPYPWCREPKRCEGAGYCTRDPNCGE